jgi:hypothetical protein
MRSKLARMYSAAVSTSFGASCLVPLTVWIPPSERPRGKRLDLRFRRSVAGVSRDTGILRDITACPEGV